MINPISPPAVDNVHIEFRNGHMRKIISFMRLPLDGFVAVPNVEMNRTKVDEEIFDHIGKRRQHFPSRRVSKGTRRCFENIFSFSLRHPQKRNQAFLKVSDFQNEFAVSKTNVSSILLLQPRSVYSQSFN